MLIAIAASDNNLKARMDEHFGRCNWFCIYNTTTMQSEFVANPIATDFEKTGCDVASFLINAGIESIVAGRFGSKVSEILRNQNIQMIIPDKSMTMNEIINLIK